MPTPRHHIPSSSRKSTHGSGRKKSATPQKSPHSRNKHSRYYQERSDNSGHHDRNSHARQQLFYQQPGTSHSHRSSTQFRPSAQALRSTRRIKPKNNFCIHKLPFSRLAREIQKQCNTQVTHWTKDAFECLHEATEAYLTKFFSDVQLASEFASRRTIMQRDIFFIRRIRGGDL